MTTPTQNPKTTASGSGSGGSLFTTLPGPITTTTAATTNGGKVKTGATGYSGEGLPFIKQTSQAAADVTNITSTTKDNSSSIRNSKSGSSGGSTSTISHFLNIPSSPISTSKSKIFSTDVTEPDSCVPFIGSSGSLFATSSSSSSSSTSANIATDRLTIRSNSSSITSSLTPVYHHHQRQQKQKQHLVQSSSTTNTGCLEIDVDVNDLVQQQHQQHQELPHHHHQQQQHQGGGPSLNTSGGNGNGHVLYDLPSPTITSTMMMLPPLQQQQQQQQQQIQGGGGGSGCSSSSSNSNSAIIKNPVQCEQPSEFFSKGGSMGISGTSSSSSIGGLEAARSSTSMEDDSKILPDTPDSSKRPFVPCKVCGDKASGYHYGVTSCEGCKGFFRRSIQKQIEYRCLRDGKCMIIRLNRNRCQYCRFKKCLAVGMSRDSVRYGRVPKRSKSIEDHSVSSTDSCQDQSALESKQLAIYDIILNISQAHHAHCAITEDKIKNIPRNPASLRSKIRIPQGQVFFSNEELEMQRLLMWQQLAYIITPSIHSVVEFSKRVPNFSDLSQDDQLILIKTGFFEIWLIRMSRMILKEDNVVVFENGSCIPREELAVVFTPDFVTSMFEMVSSFNLLNLNDTEIGLFTGIVLTTADRQGLTDPAAVERTQDQLVEALQLQISRGHSTEENLFASIIIKAPELRTLGSQHNDLLRWYRSQWHRISLPPLFAEIYDIPKNQADAQ